MKSCPRCGTSYEHGLERCPTDGAELLPAAARSGDAGGSQARSFSLDLSDVAVEKTELFPLDESRETLEKTSDVAREIEDLIFKVCSHCRSAYHGDIDVCPRDGSRLVEPSVLARQSLFAGGSVSTALLGLRKHCPSCRLHFDLDVERCEKCDRPLAIPTLGGSPLGEEGLAGPQSLIADKYRVLSTIDSGGFGCVHLAKHESLGKRFAIKVLRGKFSDTKELRNRFHEEALKLSRLEDENVVKVFDFGESEDSQYMVTEYVDGTDLGAIIYDEKVSPLRAAKLMRQVASALAEAHAKKIVHLDLKPRNILVSQKRGRDIVKVIDFGIAEIYSESGPSRQEHVAGTCTYMSPEQWRRAPLDPRTDIYSFGVIFYELLAGRPPFRHTRVSEIEKAHLKQSPPALRKLRPDVPVELERLVQQCMEKKPERRVQSAEELEARLQSYVARTENVVRRWVVRGGVAAVACGCEAMAASLQRRPGNRGAWSMLSQRTWVLLGVVAFAGIGALLVGRGHQVEAGDRGCRLDGVWIVRFGDGLFYETFVTDASGLRGSFDIDAIISNVPNFGSESPGTGANGNIRRISPDTWAFEAISHNRTLTTATEVGSITDIRILRGVSQLADCDTQAITMDIEIFLPDADGDGDGFPDDDAEPIAVVEGFTTTARRISNL